MLKIKNLIPVHVSGVNRFLLGSFQAYQMRPSIIFFDEIDGLAPVRSSRQDQIHRSGLFAVHVSWLYLIFNNSVK